VALEEAISDIIADYWLNVNPYCGMPSSEVYNRLPEDFQIKAPIEDIRSELQKMDENGKVSIREVHGDLWVYPKKKLLKIYDSSKAEEVGLYTKQLRLGGSQIEHRFFRRQVIDRYKQDPRYRFGEWDYGGTIQISDEAYLDSSVPESDKVSIQSFGIAYTDKGEKVVAVILSDLGDLSVEHQRYWSSFEIKKKYALDSDYVRTDFEAEFSDRISIFSAFTQELEEINKICALIGEQPLFKKTFVNDPPREFNWLTKPTTREYNSFIHTLDKMISENIDRDFFKGKIELNEEIQNDNGKVRVVSKGSIRLLEEYLAKYWRFPHPEPKNEMIRAFRNIRKARQKPAHVAVEDKYDITYPQQQRNLIFQAYRAIRTLRLLLMKHPKVKSYVPPRVAPKRTNRLSRTRLVSARNCTSILHKLLLCMCSKFWFFKAFTKSMSNSP